MQWKVVMVWTYSGAVGLNSAPGYPMGHGMEGCTLLQR